jgi:hypothetical protein
MKNEELIMWWAMRPGQKRPVKGTEEVWDKVTRFFETVKQALLPFATSLVIEVKEARKRLGRDRAKYAAELEGKRKSLVELIWSVWPWTDEMLERGAAGDFDVLWRVTAKLWELDSAWTKETLLAEVSLARALDFTPDDTVLIAKLFKVHNPRLNVVWPPVRWPGKQIGY